MGRIKGRKPEQTREAVLEAATWAFAERGFANATLGMIAARAGVTAATLPYHFDSKQGLYDAVVDNIYKGLLSFAQQMQPFTALRDLMSQVYAWAERGRDGIRVLLRAIIEGGGIDWKVRERRMGPAMGFVSQRMAAHFGVPPENARRALIALTHLIMRFVTNSIDDNRLAFGVDTDAEARAEIISMLVSVGSHLMGLDEA